MYWDLSLSNTQIKGSCGDFFVLFSDSVPTNRISYRPVSISLYTIEGKNLMTRDPSSIIDNEVVSVTCDTPDVVASFLDDMKKFLSSSTPSLPSTSRLLNRYDCGSSQWSIFRCSDSRDSLVICVNCSNYCDMPSNSSLSVSCSYPSRDPMGTLSILYFEFNLLSPPPSFVSKKIISVTSTSARVAFVMDGPGYLTCAAFSPLVAPSSSEMLVIQGLAVPGEPLLSSSSTIASYELSGLSPASSFDIYCSSISLTSAPMPTLAMLRSKLSIRTLCCRTVVVNLNLLSLDDVSPSSSALTLNVGKERISNSLHVKVLGYQTTTMETRELFVPSISSFTVDSRSSQIALTYVPVLAGLYRLNVSLSGPSSNDYRIVFPAGDTLLVKGLEESGAPPQLQSSEFSSDGSKIIINFNTPTNRGGALNSFQCSSLFELNSLPSSSRCHWLSDVSVEISAIGTVVQVGDILGLKGGALKAKCTSKVDPLCSQWLLNDPDNSSVNVPRSRAVPIVAFSVPSSIGACDDLVLDLTASSGSGGRPWKSVIFLVTGLSPNITLLQQFLSTPGSISSPIVIPNSRLTSGYSYSLEVIVCNFLNQCGMRMKSVVVSSSTNVPIASLFSQNLISIFRNNSLSVSGDGYTAICGRGITRANLLYTWILYENTNELLDVEMRSVSVNPREFALPAYRLKVDVLYTLKLVVKHSKSLKSSVKTVQILVKNGELVCDSGGEEFSLRLDGSLVLDFSKSFDTNDNIFESGVAPLQFEFSCFQISPVYSDECFSLTFSPLAFSSSRILVSVSSEISPTTKDIFKVSFQAHSIDQRLCEKSIQISILESLAPVVTLQIASKSKMNPSSKLKLVGGVDMKSSGLLVWSINDKSVDLSSISLSPITTVLPASGVSQNLLNLVLVGNSLSGGTNFVFTLSCTLENGYSSSSSVTIATNSPPLGGTLLVIPSDGVMFETIFSFQTSGWVDEDLPITYQFGYLTSSLLLTVFRSKIELSYTSTVLPSGSKGTISNLTSAVDVFDSLDSSVQSTFGVSVEEVKMSLADLNSFLISGINGSKVNSNSDDLKSVISSVTNILNRVNCSNSPDCHLLNRLDCSLVEGTCGNCLPGFIGLSGSSNTRCASWAGLLTRRILVTSSKSAKISCQSDLDCEFGVFLHCNDTSNQCEPMQQLCPNSCSGHGNCLFVSKFDPNLTLSRCEMLETHCTPRCECEDGYMGSSCSFLSADFFKQMELRHIIIENVRDLMSMENPSGSSVISWMRSLSSVCTDYLTLSLESKRLLASLSVRTLEIASDLGLSIEEIVDAGMDTVVDMSVSGLTSVQDADDVDNELLLMSLLKTRSKLFLGDMSEDQYPVSSVATYFRSSSFFLSSSLPSSSSVLIIPKSELETLSVSNEVSQSIELMSGISYPVRISISETVPRLSKNTTATTNNSTVLSLPIYVSMESIPCQSNEVNCVMKVILHNKLKIASPTRQQDPLSTSFLVICKIGAIEEHIFFCPSGETLKITCNGTFNARGQHFCPVSTTVADCQTSLSLGSSHTPCSLSEFNETITVCLCDLSKIQKLSDLDTSVSFSILSIQKSLVNEFVTTWETIPSLQISDVANSWTVLLTVGMIVAVFASLLLAGMRLDETERKRLKEQNNKLKVKSFLQHLATQQLVRPQLLGTPCPVGESKAKLDRNQDIALIDETLPSIFKTDSLWNKFKHEMQVYHRWLGIVFFYSPAFPRSMRVLSLFTSIVIMLFIQSVVYNIADPDDGSCEQCEEETCCLSLQSTLNLNENRCYWQPDDEIDHQMNESSHDDGSCHFREIGADMSRMFIVAVFSSIISAPLALSVQYLIGNILSKETETKDEEQDPRLRSRSLSGRGLAITSKSPDLVEACGGSLQEDLNNLLRELSQFFNRLESQQAQDELQGFFLPSSQIIPNLFSSYPTSVGAWGSLARNTEARSRNSLIASVQSLRFSRDASHQNAMSDLMQELASVRKEVSHEYQWFLSAEKGAFTTELQSQSSSLRILRKRLLYLFVKDLTVGVSRDVLSDKAARDAMLASMKVNQVSPEIKVLSWLFVIFLNGAMLMYVYLFAINQTSSRQSAWFQSFVLWLFFEIIISSTGLVLIMQLLIPLYVLTDVMKIKRKVLSDLLIFREKYSSTPAANNNEVSPSSSSSSTHAPPQTLRSTAASSPIAQSINGNEFNAAKYLYPSWRIAALCKHIPESRFILQFSTPWPKKKFGDEVEMSSFYEEAVLSSALSRILLFFITSLLHFNDLFQDIIVQILSNSGLGYLCYLLIELSRIHLFLPLGLIFTLLLCIHFFVKSQTRSSVLSKMNLIHPSSGELERTSPTHAAASATSSVPLPYFLDGDEVSESEVDMLEVEYSSSDESLPLHLALPHHFHHSSQQHVDSSPNSSLGSPPDHEEQEEFIDFIGLLPYEGEEGEEGLMYISE